ncbi:MAG: hypothetical protein LBT55_00525 [Clostridiaceae bacterium]|jgi:hypothetical protein|nr:hypothetical protein [Clostridiaceae bacterium]
MTNLEKMCMLYEDVFEASILWSNDGERLYIFTEDIRECDFIKEIKEAMKRPLRKVPDSEKVCTPGDFGPIEVSRYNDINGVECYWLYNELDQGYYSMNMFPYLDYFLNRQIETYKNGKKIKKLLDDYFELRLKQISEE